MRYRTVIAAALSAAVIAAVAMPAAAEMQEIHAAKQYGISYLGLMVMEHDNLFEKHAKAAGLPDAKVVWSTFSSGSVMNDALLSGNLQFAAEGVGPFVTLWAKTHGNIGVKGIAAMNSMPLYLNTRDPNVKTIKDFTDKDKIALPAVKVSIQAVTLQMAAAQAFGDANANKLDALTVSMSHPQGMAALLSGKGEITAHLTSPPFQTQELKDKNIHRVFSSYDVLGGPATFNVIAATTRFHDENPKTYKAFVDAFKEATDWINANRKAAAELYLEMTKDKHSSVADILEILNDPDNKYTLTPNNVMKYVEFMHKIGSIKTVPASWKDMFFDNAHGLQGS
jgi:NitT/TauT family transport system substrate-binding protein